MRFATPLGVHLVSTAKVASRAFDEALAAVGGSRPMWLIMISVKSQQLANQRQLAEKVGIQGATLTHHLNAMESAGLITRRRDPANRRMHVVELTETGEALFHRLREAAVTFDARLRAGLSDEELTTFDAILTKIATNIG